MHSNVPQVFLVIKFGKTSNECHCHNQITFAVRHILEDDAYLIVLDKSVVLSGVGRLLDLNVLR